METIVTFNDPAQANLTFQNVAEIGMMPGFVVLNNGNKKTIALLNAGAVASVVQPAHDTCITLKP